MVARPGVRPVRSLNASTSRATSARTFAAIALPSMISALTASKLPLLERGVFGHQLALAAVAREADDDHAAGLGAGHDTLAERGVQDVVAHAEAAAGGLGRLGPHRGPRGRRPRPDLAVAAAPAPRREGAGRALAVDEVGGDLVEEPRRQPV